MQKIKCSTFSSGKLFSVGNHLVFNEKLKCLLSTFSVPKSENVRPLSYPAHTNLAFIII